MPRRPTASELAAFRDPRMLVERAIPDPAVDASSKKPRRTVTINLSESPAILAPCAWPSVWPAIAGGRETPRRL